jgi:glutathione S-transferase
MLLQWTWADFWFASQYDYVNHMCGTDIFANYPNLKALKNKVIALPQISKFLASRAPVRF